MDENTLDTVATDTTTEISQENTDARTYTQDEFDKHMAGLKASLTRKFEKQFQELGDLDELKSIKAEAESRKIEEAKKRGDFDKLMQELAHKKDAEIQKRDSVIKEYKIDMPLVNAAAKFKSVNPEQVSSLLKSQVKLNEDGEVEVLDNNGQVRYGDDGKLLSVDSFVQEFLQTNPHFVQSSPATTNTNTSVKSSGVDNMANFDLNNLDLTRADHRQVYKQAKFKGLV